MRQPMRPEQQRRTHREPQTGRQQRRRAALPQGGKPHECAHAGHQDGGIGWAEQHQAARQPRRGSRPAGRHPIAAAKGREQGGEGKHGGGRARPGYLPRVEGPAAQHGGREKHRPAGQPVGEHPPPEPRRQRRKQPQRRDPAQDVGYVERLARHDRDERGGQQGVSCGIEMVGGRQIAAGPAMRRQEIGRLVRPAEPRGGGQVMSGPSGCCAWTCTNLRTNSAIRASRPAVCSHPAFAATPRLHLDNPLGRAGRPI